MHATYCLNDDKKLADFAEKQSKATNDIFEIAPNCFNAEADKVITAIRSITNLLCDELQIEKISFLTSNGSAAISNQISRIENIIEIATEITSCPFGLIDTDTSHSEQ